MSRVPIRRPADGGVRAGHGGGARRRGAVRLRAAASGPERVGGREPAGARQPVRRRAEDGFVRTLAARGSRGGVLTPAERRRAARGAGALRAQGRRGSRAPRGCWPGPGALARWWSPGRSLEDRDETLAGLVAAFAIGGPLAILLASLLGYGLAAGALRPVEAMRRRATEVSLEERRRAAAAARGPGRDPRPGPDAERDAGPPARLVRARAAVRGGREPRAAHPGGGGQGRAGGGAAGRRPRTAARASRWWRRCEECDSLAQLAEDLLVLARSAEGQLPVRRERVEPRSCSESVRRRFADRAGERGREIRVGGARRACVSKPTRCGCARRSGTSWTTRCATARARW